MTMTTLPLDHRAPRTSFTLSETDGVYALFLGPGSSLPGIVPVRRMRSVLAGSDVAKDAA